MCVTSGFVRFHQQLFSSPALKYNMLSGLTIFLAAITATQSKNPNLESNLMKCTTRGMVFAAPFTHSSSHVLVHSSHPYNSSGFKQSSGGNKHSAGHNHHGVQLTEIVACSNCQESLLLNHFQWGHSRRPWWIMLEHTSKVASFPGPAQFSVICTQGDTGNKATSKVRKFPM